VRENFRISRHDIWTPVQHPSDAGNPHWHICNDITRENIESIIEIIEDLFT